MMTSHDFVIVSLAVDEVHSFKVVHVLLRMNYLQSLKCHVDIEIKTFTELLR